MWQRHSQPRAFSRAEAQERRGLRVVDEADVEVVVELLRVELVVAEPDRPLLLGEVLRVALERVVHLLGRVEELLAAVDDVPVGLEADVAHQRDERVEQLAHPAAERGRRDVRDAQALAAARRARAPRRSARARPGACSRRATCARRGRAAARGAGYRARWRRHGRLSRAARGRTSSARGCSRRSARRPCARTARARSPGRARIRGARRRCRTARRRVAARRAGSPCRGR